MCAETSLTLKTANKIRKKIQNYNVNIFVIGPKSVTLSL